MRIFSKKFFSAFFLHHRIELELLITKNYFLALANTSFRSKNTKYSKGVVFREKHILSRNVQNFLLYSFFLLLKISFSDYASKLSRKKLLNRLRAQNSIGGSASNRVECTTYRWILQTYLVFLHKGWSEIFYLIRFIIPSVTKLRIAFLKVFLLCRENSVLLVQ
jgi:hypothetical protein